MPLLKALGDFCALLNRDQHVPQQKWIKDMIFGIVSSHSLMLSEIGRALKEPSRLIQTEKRLSRNLNSNRLDDEALLTRHLEMTSKATKKDNGEGLVIAVDYTDLNKPRANLYTGMELVCQCHDGSEGEVGTGYPVVQLEAHLANGNQRPLFYKVFSTRHQDYKEQNAEFIDAIRKASPYVGSRAWWTFDRGFDANRMYDGLDDVGVRWITRLKIGGGERARHLIDVESGKKATCRDWALATKTTWTVGRKRGKGLKRKDVTISIGMRHVRLPEVPGKDRTLVVVYQTGWTEPLVLLVSERLEGEAAIVEAMKAYTRRWKCEEATRGMKDSRGWGVRLEDLRALTFRGVQRLVTLACLAYSFMAELRDAAKDIVTRVVSAVKSFGKAPKDIRYRLMHGLGEIFERVTRGRRLRWRKGADLRT